MPLESPIYVNDFVITNPTSGDPKSQGDDHIRNTKAALKVTFSGFLGAVIVRGTESGPVPAGGVTSYVVNPATAIPSLQLHMRVVFAPVNANIGPATLAVSGLGALPIIHANGQPLTAGDIPAGRVVEVVYDGTSFQIVGGSGYLSRTGNQTLNGTFAATGSITTAGNFIANGAGTNDFTAGTTLVKTLPAGSPDSLNAVSVAMLNAVAFSAVLPGQTGKDGSLLFSRGGSAVWEAKSTDLATMALGII